MSLFGSELSFVSLGCSCQTARQIDDNVAVIDASFGSNGSMTRGGSYFDSLITPIETLIRFIEQGITSLPGPARLRDNVGPYWPDAPLWFYHYFKGADGRLDTDPQHADYKKIAYLGEKFRAISTPTIFVLSNTQNNLHIFHEDGEFVDLFGFTDRRIARLSRALETKFGENFSGLIVVENQRTAFSHTDAPRVLRTRVGLDESEWKGNGAAWAKIFEGAADQLSYRPGGALQSSKMIATGAVKAL